MKSHIWHLLRTPLPGSFVLKPDLGWPSGATQLPTGRVAAGAAHTSGRTPPERCAFLEIAGSGKNVIGGCSQTLVALEQIWTNRPCLEKKKKLGKGRNVLIIF